MVSPVLDQDGWKSNGLWFAHARLVSSPANTRWRVRVAADHALATGVVECDNPSGH